ncbi:M48 family metallopeptidase [Celeribacter arenosi]|uniref:M48 family metallopeptidase n=1 Tax=Celeribacter arenosi TaxID=792649 RepID=A0ABP7KJE7_9RHOB
MASLADRPVSFGTLTGVASRAGASHRQPARYVIDQSGARLVGENGETLVHGMPVRREASFGGTLDLDLPDGWRFSTEDIKGARAVLGEEPGAWLSNLESWHPRLVLVLIGCLLGAYAIWRWGLNVLVTLAITVTPPTLVGAIDRGNLSAMDQFLAEPTALSAVEQARVRGIFDSIAAAAPQSDFGPYRLEFRDMPAVGANAFALPGGTVVVTDDMVAEFGGDDILAGVIGHELAHVSEEHSLRQLYRSLSVYLLIALIAGDVGPILEDVLLEGSAIVSLSYSRTHEADADALGVATARVAGYDPAALAEFFRRLEAEYGDGGPAWLSTHPANADRIEQIERLAAE